MNSITRLVEHGFNIHVYERTITDLVGTAFGTEVPLSVQLKISSHVEEDSADVMAINYGHVKEVIYMLLFGISLAFVALIVEIGRKKFTDRQSMSKVSPVRVVNIAGSKKRIIKSA